MRVSAPHPFRCHSQKRQVGTFDGLVFANRTDGTGVRSGMYLSSARCSPTPLLTPCQSMHLRLVGMDRGDPAIRRRRQLLVLHHVAARCLRPVAYRGVFTRDLSTANSLRWQPALDLDFALALHARRLPGLSIRLFPLTGIVRSISLTLSTDYIGT